MKRTKSMSLGRLLSKDYRDSKYLLKSRSRIPLQSKYWNSYGWHGNQGDNQSCIGYGWSHWLHCSPIRQFMRPEGIYELAQKYDEWSFMPHDGSTVRAGAKVLSMLGAINEYRWTWDAYTVANHIVKVGPVVLGVNWYEYMDEPDKNGLMKVQGENYGGHCICATGFNHRDKLIKIKNSYGEEDWGKKGYGYLRIKDLNRLLDEDGEACVGVESDLRPWKGKT